jgi:hypothetical protein
MPPLQILRHIDAPYSPQLFLLLVGFFRRPDVVAAYSAKVGERATVINFLGTATDELQNTLTADDVTAARSLRNAYVKS